MDRIRFYELNYFYFQMILSYVAIFIGIAQLVVAMHVPISTNRDRFTSLLSSTEDLWLDLRKPSSTHYL